MVLFVNWGDNIDMKYLVFIFFFLTTSLSCFSIDASDNRRYSIKPKTNNGKRWRIGYLEGGAFSNYPINLKALVEALADLGWVEIINEIPLNDESDTRDLWAWISRNVKSKYIKFLPDAYWSSNWDMKKLRKKNKRIIIKRLKFKKDIDLMLAMGTWAGQDLANNRHSTPVVVMSSSNPIDSKIIKSAQDSGYNHVNARVDPTRYERQVRLFHDIIGFTKLGIVYETDTVEGRTYAAISDVQKVAKERGFEIIQCNASFSSVSKKDATQALFDCHEKIAPKVDAFYLTVHRGVTLNKMSQLLPPLFEHKIPTFSQKGALEVKYGVLFSIARAGFKYISRFHAETIAQILNGARPRDLEQVFEDPPRIAINTKTAQIIGYDPPVEILETADEIYTEIAVKK